MKTNNLFHRKKSEPKQQAGVRTCFGTCTFAVAAPTTWNSLPLHILNSSSIFGFRRQLKTFLCKLAFDPTHLQQRLRFGGFPPTLHAL